MPMPRSAMETSLVARPTLRRGRPRDDRLDAVIVDATVAEVGAKGWGGATIEGIAARAEE